MNLAFELDLIVRGLTEFPENEYSSAALIELQPIAAKLSVLKEQTTEDVLSKDQKIASLLSIKTELDVIDSVLPFVKIAAEDLLRFATTLEESE